jgi:CHAT domain-containing protein
MTYQNELRSATDSGKRPFFYKSLANFLALSLFSNLSPIASSPQALGSALCHTQQSAQEATSPQNSAGDENDVRPLEQGRPVKRELSVAQRHSYRLRLSADQFLKAIIEQQGIDVVAQISGPDGAQIVEYDSEGGLQGREEVSLVAEVAGDYQLVVLPTQNRASEGSYEIRIEEMRAATENDRALFEAHMLYKESMKLRDAGKYDEALPLFERVIETRKRILGPDAPDLAAVIHDLAVFYYYRGDYPRAESLSNRALAIQEKKLGPEHPHVATSLNLLASFYSNKGAYAKAESLSSRAVAIKEKELGPEHPKLAYYLRTLARIYYKKGAYDIAEPFYLRALAIREKTLELEHRLVAQSLNDLANLYYDKGDGAKAESLHKRALTIQEKWLEPQHPNVAESLCNLANIYRDRKDYAQAEPLYLRALAIQEKTKGPQSPHVARVLNNLAMFYAAKGAIAQAIAVQSRANAVTEYNLALNIATGSERQKLAFLAIFSKQTDFTLWLHSQAAPGNPEALDLAFTTLLRRKARGLDAMTDTIVTFRRHATPQDQALFDQLTDARSQLAELTLRESGATISETSSVRLKLLEEKVEDLEAELSARSAEFRAQTQSVTLAAVQETLPADTILVEFAVLTPWDPRTEKSGAPRYLAYALSAQGQPKWVDLGEAAQIEREVGAWRQSLRENSVDVKQLGRAVDELVMRPVRSSLQSESGQIRHLLIAPDGALNLIPFAALVDEENRYLIERYTISYLTSGRDLLRLRNPQPSKSAPLVLANPLFDGIASAATRGSRNSASSPSGAGAGGQGKTRSDPARIFFKPLPGTEGEALAIKAVLPEASLLLERQATEAALKRASAPRILHIATHGFFLDDQEEQRAESRNIPGNDPRRISDLRLGRWAAQIENPLLRSGLALSGANRGKSGDDDGLLTALEVAGLDLWGTKLVVLSACDTGLGEIKNGEGVQGLRRALVLAGSESQVISLWAVPDELAKDVIIPYYKALRRGEGRGAGLRQVQLRMLRSRDRHHPFYWAAFIQSGEWVNLDGRR